MGILTYPKFKGHIFWELSQEEFEELTNWLKKRPDGNYPLNLYIHDLKLQGKTKTAKKLTIPL